MDGGTTRKTTTRRWKGHANSIPSLTIRWKNAVSSRASTHNGSPRGIPPRKTRSRTDTVTKTKTATKIGTHDINTSVPPTWYTPSLEEKSPSSQNMKESSWKGLALMWTSPMVRSPILNSLPGRTKRFPSIGRTSGPPSQNQGVFLWSWTHASTASGSSECSSTG